MYVYCLSRNRPTTAGLRRLGQKRQAICDRDMSIDYEIKSSSILSIIRLGYAGQSFSFPSLPFILCHLSCFQKSKRNPADRPAALPWKGADRGPLLLQYYYHSTTTQPPALPLHATPRATSLLASCSC
jgi:hypothetical protein